MTSNLYRTFAVVVCVLMLGGAKTFLHAQSETNQTPTLDDIRQAYNNVEPERVIELAARFLNQPKSIDAKTKILVYEMKAYSELDLDREADARQSIIEVLREDPEFKPDERKVPPQKVQFVEKVKQAHLAKLTVYSTPGGAKVYINGEYKDNSACTFSLLYGSYNVKIASPDPAVYKDWQSSIQLEGGAKREINAVLEKFPVAEQHEAPIAEEPKKEKKPWYKNPFVLGAGGLLLAGGIVAALSGGDDEQDGPQALPSHPSRPTR